MDEDKVKKIREAFQTSSALQTQAERRLRKTPLPSLQPKFVFNEETEEYELILTPKEKKSN